MAKVGLVVNLLAALIVAVVSWTLAVPVLGIDPTTAPAWANQPRP